MNIFISGGCKNGKSYHAQELARDMAKEKQVPLYYLATMIPADDEDRARIRRHLSEREGWGFDTIEQGRHILRCLPPARTGGLAAGGMPTSGGPVPQAAQEAGTTTVPGEPVPQTARGAGKVSTAGGMSAAGGMPATGRVPATDEGPATGGVPPVLPTTLSGAPIQTDGVFLLDSVTALLSNEMFLPDGAFDPDAGHHLAEELTEFAHRTGNTVFVSDYIYSDARRFDAYTEAYRRGLALIDRTLARVCDQVVEVTFGMKYLYK